MALTYKQKYSILSFYEVGMTQIEISKKVKTSQATVSRLLAKHAKHGTVEHLKGNGRHLVILDKISKAIIGQRKKNPKTSLRKMVNIVNKETGQAIGRNTIARWYNRNNIFAYTPISKPLLIKRHIKLRFEAAKRIIFMSDEEIQKVIFTDESKFNLFYLDGKCSVWREPSTGLKPENLNKTVKHGGGSVMVWGCFSYQGVGKLHIIDGIMDAAAYVNILARNLTPSATQMGLGDFIFQQDNDPKHTSRLAEHYFMPKTLISSKIGLRNHQISIQ